LIAAVFSLLTMSCAPQPITLVFPGEKISPIELKWVPAKSDDDSVIQEVDELTILQSSTYEANTPDIVDGQAVDKSVYWSVYPSVERENEVDFPVELVVETGENAVPHPGYSAVLKKTIDRTQLSWTANEPRVPSRFGAFGIKTGGTVRGVVILRHCEPLGDGRARINITVRATVRLLIRVWGLKRQVQIEPDSIKSSDHRLSDNGVLSFEYGKDWETLGRENVHSFIISGLKEGQLFYPQTSALHQIRKKSSNCPLGPVQNLHGSVFGFNFSLNSERPFRINNIYRRADRLYELKSLMVKQ
jgi:hypothetical protein